MEAHIKIKIDIEQLKELCTRRLTELDLKGRKITIEVGHGDAED